MKRIAITGANGTIGTVLSNGLKNYEIIPIDLPMLDARDYEKLLKAVQGSDVIVHLAWNTEIENFRSSKIEVGNILMVYNVYKAALEAKIPRVIMASSVHADNFYKWGKADLMQPQKIPEPTSPYGACKIFLEALGRYYSTKGLEVICIRFGGVNKENKPPSEVFEKRVWLSHGDCVGLVRKCIEADKIPDNFLVVYAVSNNKNRIHDFSNPFGWVPKDDSSSF